MNQPPAQASKNLGLSPMEGVIAGFVAFLVVLSFIFYITGEVSGLLFKFSRPGTPLTQFFSITGGVISNPGNPASAWPAEYQSKIPGPVLYYLTMIGLCVGGLFLFRFLKDLWTGVGKSDLNQAQWAKTKDIKTLIVPHAGIRGRLVLGRSNGKLIATEPRQSVIVMGPTQTGKTTGFAVPAILEWDGPVIAASVKNDLVKDTFKWRKTQGEVWLFDPTRSTGFDYEDVRAGWSPLSQAIDWGGARKVSSWLCKANKSAGSNLSDGDFWFSAAEKMMSPYLFAAAVGGKDMSTILRWIDTQEEREVMTILQKAGVPEAMTAFQANMKRDERTKSSIFTTAETIIDAYNDPLVCESAADPAIFSSELLNGGHNTLYICAPSHEQDRLQSIFTAIVSQMKSAAYELAGKQNKSIDPPLLICIDEAANIAPLSDLDAIASTAAGIGIQLVTIFQDMAQIEARYKEKSRTVVNNHRAKVILSGISDTGTLEYVSKLCGEEEIDQQSTSTSAQGERSTTDSKQSRTLASGAYLRRMKFGEGIVVYGQLSPAKLILRQWFKDRVLKHMVEHGTKPGVVGGPSGSNSFGGGSSIVKDKASIPEMSTISQDSRYKSGDAGNQMSPPSPLSGGPATPGASLPPGEMSAFDKALAELRARDSGQPGDTTSSPQSGVPVVPSTTIPPIPPVPSSLNSESKPSGASSTSPSKWKPSGGGLVEEAASATTSSPAVPSSSSIIQPEVDALSSVPETSSKWSKGARPEFVEPVASPASQPLVNPPVAQPPTPLVQPPTPVVATPAPTTPTPLAPPITQPEVQPISDVFSQYSTPERPLQSQPEETDEENPSIFEDQLTDVSKPKSKWK